MNTDFWAGLHHKEGLLAQKSRVSWIQQGDGNTIFFHNMVKLRQRKNHIELLKVGEGWISGVEEIKEKVRRHFSCQFKDENVERPNLDGVQFQRITKTEAELVTVPFTTEEVREAVWSCEGNKSPGPDEFNFTFIKSC